MSHLFDPFTLRSLTFSNRILVSPMCQYSSVDGSRRTGTTCTSEAAPSAARPLCSPKRPPLPPTAESARRISGSTTIATSKDSSGSSALFTGRRRWPLRSSRTRDAKAAPCVRWEPMGGANRAVRRRLGTGRADRRGVHGRLSGAARAHSPRDPRDRRGLPRGGPVARWPRASTSSRCTRLTGICCMSSCRRS